MIQVSRTLLVCTLLALVPFQSACLVETPLPNLAGQDVRLTVIHTSDLHSRFFPYEFSPGAIDKGLGLVPRVGRTTALIGGIARIATVINCIRGNTSGEICDKLEPV